MPPLTYPNPISHAHAAKQTFFSPLPLLTFYDLCCPTPSCPKGINMGSNFKDLNIFLNGSKNKGKS
jgi:hypothetical protein